MRPQTILVVALALAFGGIAAVGVLAFAKGDDSGAAKGTIVIATADIPRGVAITAESIVAKEYPKDLIPVGVLTKVEDAVGRAARTPLFKDEPLLDVKLAPKGEGRGLASILKYGMRAVTIPTPAVAMNVAGHLEPGSHVDVLWTPQENTREDRATSGDTPLLENIEVLAVDDRIDPATTGKADASPIKSVTVQLKPEDATKLAPALTRGTIHLSLRNPADDGRAPPRPVAIAPPPKRVVAAIPAPVVPLTIRTFRGAREGWVKVGGPGTFATAK